MYKDWISKYFEHPEEGIYLRYKMFIEDDDLEVLEYPGSRVIANSILGSEQFLRDVVAKTDDDRLLMDFVGKSRLLRSFSLEELYGVVCARYGLETRKIAGSGAGDRWLQSEVEEIILMLRG